MQADGESKKRQILLIDGGNTYQRLIDRLRISFDLVHVRSPTEGFEFANNCSSLDGILVDLIQGSRPTEMARPSLLGLWVVDQLREFTTCSETQILVASHWRPEVIEQAASDAKIDLRSFDCHYVQMSEVDTILEFFCNGRGTD